MAGTPGSTSSGLGPQCAITSASFATRIGTEAGTLLNCSGTRPESRSFFAAPASR